MNPERSQGRGWVRIPASRAEQPAAAPPYGRPGRPDHPAIYLSLVKHWREAGRTLPGHPDEEWERLISQPCWPGP
ncbi:hypothetical protein ACM614_01345 [Streptomyces sp. 12297]|uniref:hypothetical protein n=1 Tax=Streptomyces sp. NBC_00239 TaxID=2903640 RepID=UPI002E2835FA|nr:hypothetical protein [Streptomyces sp. NBC_00239]